MGNQPQRSGKDLVDPELWPLLEQFPTIVPSNENLAERRGRQLRPSPADITPVERTVCRISSAHGAHEIELYCYRPRGTPAPSPAILHIHGGGFIAGSAAQIDTLLRKLCAESSCAIVAVDYRLAPETPFPGALQDCLDAFDWMHRNAKALGIDPCRIGLWGESAGGCLAAALALLCRDQGLARSIACLHLIAPALDDRTCLRDATVPPFGEHMWTLAHNIYAWRSYLGGEPGVADISCYAAPARAADLKGLPPTYISVGALDLFLDEDVAFAGRLAAASVPVELHVWPRAFHGFELIGDGAHVARRARSASLIAVRRALDQPAGLAEVKGSERSPARTLPAEC